MPKSPQNCQITENEAKATKKMSLKRPRTISKLLKLMWKWSKTISKLNNDIC